MLNVEAVLLNLICWGGGDEFKNTSRSYFWRVVSLILISRSLRFLIPGKIWRVSLLWSFFKLLGFRFRLFSISESTIHCHALIKLPKHASNVHIYTPGPIDFGIVIYKEEIFWTWSHNICSKRNGGSGSCHVNLKMTHLLILSKWVSLL